MLDLRFPIGLLFVILGTLILVWGYISPSTTAIGTLSVNLNITWGSIMGLFGLGMLMLCRVDKPTD